MDTYALILQSDYNQVTLGLSKNGKLQNTNIDSKHNASKNLISRMNELLEKSKINWKDISFIGINQGPAPFTTLRVIVTTANGLNFAHNIPLVGVDGITTFLKEQHAQTTVKVVLLNAFAKDVYFGIETENGIKTGWQNHELFLSSLKNQFPNIAITFIGNGTLLYKNRIKKIFEENAMFPDPMPEYTTLKAICTTACKQWDKKENVQQNLLPLYLKTKEYKKAL
jgi:tRNA threonylcarbamoyl adenosine modification protein YeaZ